MGARRLNVRILNCLVNCSKEFNFQLVPRKLLMVKKRTGKNRSQAKIVHSIDGTSDVPRVSAYYGVPGR